MRFDCDIHTFDHTVEQPTPPKYVHFHSYALASSAQVERDSGGIFMTLKQLYEITSLANEVIDVLKIDIEGAEHSALTEVSTLAFLKEHVRQLLIEVHFTNVTGMERLGVGLRDAGFRTFSVEPNLVGCLHGECSEFSMLNINLL